MSTHSLKATMLAWAAMAGWSLELRRFLGHHQQPGDQSALTYSRDAMSAPMTALVRMLDDISSGRFDPDASRSGRIKRTGGVFGEPNAAAGRNVVGPSELAEFEHHETELTQPVEQVEPVFEPAVSTMQPATSDASDSSDSDSDDSSTSSDTDDDLVVAREVELIKTVRPDIISAATETDSSGEDLFQHRVFSTAHRRVDGQTVSFRCGRRVHAGYCKFDGVGIHMWPKCKQCFG